MSSVAIIVAKLKAHAALTALVPTECIQAGLMPQVIRLPAISVTLVASEARTPVKRAVTLVHHTDIVRVSVLVSGLTAQGDRSSTGYPALAAILAQVFAACGPTRGTVAGVTVDSITPGTEGPDIPSEAPDTVSRSRDFFVRWSN